MPTPESLKRAKEVTIKHWPVACIDRYEAHVQEVAKALDEAKGDTSGCPGAPLKTRWTAWYANLKNGSQ